MPGSSWGSPPSARVVLFLGRLSFHSKAHPLPLYRALERLSADHELGAAGVRTHFQCRHRRGL